MNKYNGTGWFNRKRAYCYRGRCNSHISQCHLIWGAGVDKALVRALMKALQAAVSVVIPLVNGYLW